MRSSRTVEETEIGITPFGRRPDERVSRAYAFLGYGRSLDYDLAEIEVSQLTALRERFAEQRQQLPVLNQRASAMAVTEIRQLSDAVPLLFSHTTYNSYPASFLQKGCWDLMTRWLGTLSTHSTANLNLGGVNSIEDWIGGAPSRGSCH